MAEVKSMIEVYNLILDNIHRISGLLVLVFALMVSIILIFSKTSTKKDKEENKIITNNQNKLIGIIVVTSLVLFANDQWTYLLGLVIIGTIITGTEFMLEFIKWMKTTRNETSDEKRVKVDYSIKEQASKPD